jgi:hypothetical protein
MTIATLSVYPRSLDDLLPAARDLAVELGGVPSRNQLMRQLKVGAPKATELRQQLLAELGPGMTDHTPVPAQPVVTPLAPEPDAIPATTTPVPEQTSDPEPITPVIDTQPQAVPAGHPAPLTPPAVTVAPPAPAAAVVPVVRPRRKPLVWPVLLLSLPAFVAIWSGWVELGELAGFGIVHPLPGIADEVTFNTAITLPIGVETYAAYALWVWLSGRAPRPARRFAKWSALGSLVFGAAGQIAYHLLAAAGVTSAPWQITSAVACLPVAVLGMGAALAHLMHADDETD